MIDHVFQRMFWKEYRSLRGLWLTVLGVALFWQLRIVWNSPSQSEFLPLMSVALWASAFYALGCGAVSFAAEREDGMLEFLHVVVAPAKKLLVAKLAFGAVSALGLLLILAPAALFFSGQSISSTAWSIPSSTATKWLFIAVWNLLWGAFFSMATHRVLSAACLAGLASLLSVYVVDALALVSMLWDPIGSSPSVGITEMAIGLMLAAGVLVLDHAMVRRWMVTPYYEWPGLFAKLPKRMPGRPVGTRPSADQASQTLSRRRLFVRQLAHLVWQEWRQARIEISLCFVISFVLVQLAWMDRTFSMAVNPRLMLLIAVTPAVVGVWTFRGEQQRQRFRFFADRGISPAKVWLSKHLVWASVAVLTTSVLVLPVPEFLRQLPQVLPDLWVPQPLIQAQELVSSSLNLQVAAALPANLMLSSQGKFSGQLMGHSLLFVGLAYGAGQLMSMLCSRAVVAVFAAVALSWSLTLWFRLMTSLHVPVIWSVAPLVAILPALTFVRCRDWLLERNTCREWLRFALTGLLPVALLLIAVIWSRV